MASVPRPWPSESEIRHLAERSGGQFIYASTILKFIDDENHRPADQLKLVQDASGSTAFTELDQLYQQILSTCMNIPLLLRIIGCILIAEDTLSAPEIEILLNISEGGVRPTLCRMHSILDIPDISTQPIRVLHTSLADFIFNPDRSGDYYVSAEKCHSEMALGCLRWAQLQASEAAQNSVSIWRIPAGTIFVPPIQHTYARRYWALHCSMAKPKHEISLHLIDSDDFLLSVLLPCSDGFANVHKIRITIQWLKVTSEASVIGQSVTILSLSTEP